MAELPATARRGVWAGELGMLLAIVGTLLHHGIVDYKWIAIALLLGWMIGAPLGQVQMTAVPQRTASPRVRSSVRDAGRHVGILSALAQRAAVHDGSALEEVIRGSLTFTGSLMAAGKLQEVLPQRPITYRGQNIVNLLPLAIAVALRCSWCSVRNRRRPVPVVVVIPMLFGVLMIIPIGGADMPTVISLLNSYAGLSAAAMGFRLGQ